jgi:hypothetical protein
MCETATKFCRAHIWPDGLRTIVQQKYKNIVFANIETGKDKRVQTLEVDKNILCAACDSHLGRYDRTLIEFVRAYIDNPDRKKGLDKKKPAPIITMDVDTTQLRLGFMASLYRQSLTATYPMVNLGAKYTRLFRQCLIEKKILKPVDHTFKIIMFGYVKDNDNFDRTMVPQPATSGTYGGVHFYFYHFLGLEIVMKVGRGPWMGGLDAYPDITSEPDKLNLLLCDPKQALIKKQMARLREAIQSRKNNQKN